MPKRATRMWTGFIIPPSKIAEVSTALLDFEHSQRLRLLATTGVGVSLSWPPRSRGGSTIDDDHQHTGHLTDEELASKTARQLWRAARARAARRPDRDGGIGSSA